MFSKIVFYMILSLSLALYANSAPTPAAAQGLAAREPNPLKQPSSGSSAKPNKLKKPKPTASAALPTATKPSKLKKPKPTASVGSSTRPNKLRKPKPTASVKSSKGPNKLRKPRPVVPGAEFSDDEFDDGQSLDENVDFGRRDIDFGRRE